MSRTLRTCFCSNVRGLKLCVCLCPNCLVYFGHHVWPFVPAARLLGSMKPDVDPCANFYEFACGQWVEDHRVPEDKGSTDTMEEVSTKLDEDILGIAWEHWPDTREFITRPLNFEIGGLDGHLITKKYITCVNWIYLYHLICNALLHVIFSAVSGQYSYMSWLFCTTCFQFR